MEALSAAGVPGLCHARRARRLAARRTVAHAGPRARRSGVARPAHGPAARDRGRTPGRRRRTSRRQADGGAAASRCARARRPSGSACSSTPPAGSAPSRISPRCPSCRTRSGAIASSRSDIAARTRKKSTAPSIRSGWSPRARTGISSRNTPAGFRTYRVSRILRSQNARHRLRTSCRLRSRPHTGRLRPADFIESRRRFVATLRLDARAAETSQDVADDARRLHLAAKSSTTAGSRCGAVRGRRTGALRGPGFGPRAEVIEPASLRARVMADIEALVVRFQGSKVL